MMSATQTCEPEQTFGAVITGNYARLDGTQSIIRVGVEEFLTTQSALKVSGRPSRYDDVIALLGRLREAADML